MHVPDSLHVTAFIKIIKTDNILGIIVLYFHKITEFTIPGFFIGYQISNLYIYLLSPV